jgi:DNA-directed RNA polymerase subunit RPC12/RpoP
VNTTVLILIVAGVAVLGAGVFVWMRARGPKEEAVYHFRCLGCNRRLRFRAKQTGRAGKCSHCGRDLVFPHPSKSID